MKLCHGINSLTDNGTFLHKGEEHRKFICSCGARWQWSPSSGYYQIRKRSKEWMKNYSIRLPRKPTKEEIKKFQDMLR